MLNKIVDLPYDLVVGGVVDNSARMLVLVSLAKKKVLRSIFEVTKCAELTHCDGRETSEEKNFEMALCWAGRKFRRAGLVHVPLCLRHEYGALYSIDYQLVKILSKYQPQPKSSRRVNFPSFTDPRRLKMELDIRVDMASQILALVTPCAKPPK